MVKLSNLISSLAKPQILNKKDVLVKRINPDTRTLKKGDLFIAIKGLNADGHNFISLARKNGAAAVIGERGPVDIRVSDSRKALSLLTSSFYNNPSKKLKIIGVTGTDGKTTTSNLIYWILKSANKKVGIVSTVGAKIGNKSYDTGFHVTNPEPGDLQKFLALMVKKGCEYAVLEVTSHGLDQDRVYGINFDVSVLTNITHEHLDYHKTMANYTKTKAKLFNNSKVAILNKKYSQIDKYINSTTKKIYYDKNSLPKQLLKVAATRFPEPYNILSATSAYLATKYLGVGNKDFIKAMRTFPGIEGRMQEISNTRSLRIIVDFAHTPNALKNVLSVLRRQKKVGAKIICVFGCAGERDKQKRPMMGRISSSLADISILTSEDPRHESVEEIISQISRGIKDQSKVYKIIDRQEAISFAVNKLSKAGDIIVICGKGHERSMNYNGVETPWSDKKAVLSSLTQ